MSFVPITEGPQISVDFNSSSCSFATGIDCVGFFGSPKIFLGLTEYSAFISSQPDNANDAPSYQIWGSR